jgi:nucleoside-diphosphate-sugar epimerase
MRAFITGGSGLIGTFLAKDILQRGHEITIFDSFINYLPPSENHHHEYTQKRQEWLDDPAVETIRGDTRNKSEIYRAIENSQPDVVVHLAALPIADLCNKYSEEAVSTILNGTVNVLEAIRDVDNVDRFVYASSSMIFGDFQYRPADEAHPKNPKGVYGGTKYSGEVVTRSFSNQYDIEHVIVRPSAVYGPTDANRRVTQIFVERALGGKPLELHGGGTQKLDFTYVEDTAQGFALAALHENAANETFNITRGEGRSIKELAEIVQMYAGGVETIETEASMSRPKRGALGIQKAQEMLGYEPQYSLEDGMEQYVEFVRDMGVINGV